MANVIKVDDFLKGVNDLLAEARADAQQGTDKYKEEFNKAKDMFVEVAPEIKASYDHLADASHTYTQAMMDRFSLLAADIQALYANMFPEEGGAKKGK